MDYLLTFNVYNVIIMYINIYIFSYCINAIHFIYLFSHFLLAEIRDNNPNKSKISREITSLLTCVYVHIIYTY